ncbi:hypothetical protein [Streptomyces sp. MB09-01]|uniref:hypothetical protein n=1 Tax=Streptomyces sp. MB09-01 TaxID=3028666 RepID=UPI0029C9C22D|nr:hypothetical protein [Streptomyces sp. MB09-01]
MIEHFTMLARTAARIGDRDRALSMADEAMGVMPRIQSADRRSSGWAWIAEAVGCAGDPSGVERVRRSISEDGDTMEVGEGQLARYLATAYAQANQPDRAESVARSIADQRQRAAATTAVAVDFARAGDVSRPDRTARRWLRLWVTALDPGRPAGMTGVGEVPERDLPGHGADGQGPAGRRGGD